MKGLGNTTIYRTAFLWILSIFTIGLLISCLSNNENNNQGIVQFSVSNPLPQGKIGIEYFYSLCQPALESNLDLCGGINVSSNPTGGNPPYSFLIELGGNFPPMGLTLNKNGLITGYPSIEGVTDFNVCAKDLSGNNGCATVHIEVVLASAGVTSSALCSVSPFPGIPGLYKVIISAAGTMTGQVGTTFRVLNRGSFNTVLINGCGDWTFNTQEIQCERELGQPAVTGWSARDSITAGPTIFPFEHEIVPNPDGNAIATDTGYTVTCNL